MSRYKKSKVLDVLKVILLFILVFVLLGAVAFGAVRLLRKDKQEDPAIEAGPTPLESGKWYDKIYINTADNGAAVGEYINELSKMWISYGKSTDDGLCPFIVIPEDIDVSSFGDLGSLFDDIYESFNYDGLEEVFLNGDLSKFPAMLICETQNGTSIMFDYFGCSVYERYDSIYYSGEMGYKADGDYYMVPGISKIDKDGALLQIDGSYIHGTFFAFHGNDSKFAVATPAVKEAFNKAFSATPFGNEYKNDFFTAKPFKAGQYDVYCFANTDLSAWKDLYDYMAANKKDEIRLLKVQRGGEVMDDAVVVELCEDPRGGNGWALEIDSAFCDKSFKVYDNSKEFPLNGNLFGSDYDDYNTYFAYKDSEAPKELVDKLLSRRPFKEYFPVMELNFNNSYDSDSHLFSEDRMTFDIGLLFGDVYNFNDFIDLIKEPDRLTFTLAFENPSSEWAEGKNASDYVAVSKDLKNKDITVICKAPFGERIEITLYLDGVECDTYTVGYGISSNSEPQVYDGVESDTIYRWYVEALEGDDRVHTDFLGNSEWEFYFNLYEAYTISDKFSRLFDNRNNNLSQYFLDGNEYIDKFHEVIEDWSAYHCDYDCLVGWDFGVRVELSDGWIRIGGTEGLTLEELCAWLSLDPEKIAQDEANFYQIFLDTFRDSFDLDLRTYGTMQDISLGFDVYCDCSSFRDSDFYGGRSLYISFADEIYQKCKEFGVIEY